MLQTTIHLNKNGENDDTDKFFKVKKFTDLLRMRFQNNWTLGSRILIDESTIKFKGLSNVKQYMHSKPIKWIYKMW